MFALFIFFILPTLLLCHLLEEMLLFTYLYTNGFTWGFFFRRLPIIPFHYSLGSKGIFHTHHHFLVRFFAPLLLLLSVNGYRFYEQFKWLFQISTSVDTFHRSSCCPQWLPEFINHTRESFFFSTSLLKKILYGFVPYRVGGKRSDLVKHSRIKPNPTVKHIITHTHNNAIFLPFAEKSYHIKILCILWKERGFAKFVTVFWSRNCLQRAHGWHTNKG